MPDDRVDSRHENSMAANGPNTGRAPDGRQGNGWNRRVPQASRRGPGQGEERRYRAGSHQAKPPCSMRPRVFALGTALGIGRRPRERARRPAGATRFEDPPRSGPRSFGRAMTTWHGLGAASDRDFPLMGLRGNMEVRPLRLEQKKSGTIRPTGLLRQPHSPRAIALSGGR